MPLPVHKVRTPLTLPPQPALLHSWAAAAGAAAGGLQPEAPEYAGAREGTQAVPVVAAAVTAIVLLPVSC